MTLTIKDWPDGAGGTAPAAGAAHPTQAVRVLRSFRLPGAPSDPDVGDELTLPLPLARELATYNKVEFIAAPPTTAPPDSTPAPGEA